MYKKIISSLFFFTVAISFSNAQSIKDTKLTAKIDSILQSQITNNNIPGAVIQIKRGNEVICKKAYGYAQKYDYNHQLLTQPELMTTEHLFDLASLTKVIGTTTSVMLLVDRGLINVDDYVGKYVDAFNTSDKKQITIRNLLTHTAGLITWYPLFYRASNKQEAYKIIGELPLAFPVGKERHYSDLGFILLGEIIEKVSGIPLDQFDQKNIFIPLGMNHTTYNPLASGKFKKFAATSHGNPYETRMVHDTSLGYVFKEIDPNQWNGWRKYTLRGEVNDGNAWYALGGVSGHAGLFSTIDDLQKLVDMLKNKGKVGSKQFISKKTLQLFLTKDDFKNGLGWMMGPKGTFGHGGFTGTNIAVIPQDNISIIILINRQNMGLSSTGKYYNVSPIIQQIRNIVLNNSN